MKYCPVCLDEFEDIIKICPDDNVALVNELEEVHHETELNKKLLFRFENEKIAEMVMEVLDSENIPYFKKSDIFSSALSVHGASPVGSLIKLYIPEKYIEKAKDITKGMAETVDDNNA